MKNIFPLLFLIFLFCDGCRPKEPINENCCHISYTGKQPQALLGNNGMSRLSLNNFLKKVAASNKIYLRFHHRFTKNDTIEIFDSDKLIKTAAFQTDQSLAYAGNILLTRSTFENGMITLKIKDLHCFLKADPDYQYIDIYFDPVTMTIDASYTNDLLLLS